jgi:hypothetical protein
MKKKSLRPSLKVVTQDEKITTKKQRHLASDGEIVELMDSLDGAVEGFSLKTVYQKDLSSFLIHLPKTKEFSSEELFEKDREELLLLLKESFLSLQDSYFRMQFYLDELVSSQQQHQQLDNQESFEE